MVEPSRVGDSDDVSKRYLATECTVRAASVATRGAPATLAGPPLCSAWRVACPAARGRSVRGRGGSGARTGHRAPSVLEGDDPIPPFLFKSFRSFRKMVLLGVGRDTSSVDSLCLNYLNVF